MAYLNIWGKDPKGKVRSYIGHLSPDEVDEFIAKAKAEGWTDLTTDKWQNADFPEREGEKRD